METLKRIARIYTDFVDKFGVPRQAGLCPELTGKIVFEKEYRSAHAVRGLEQFSHIWLLWGFDKADEGEYSPTVRPPRLGGNERIGVFATRSPFRPNRIGLSAVRLLKIDLDCESAPVLLVSGVDMTSDTPIYDVKPYIPSADLITDASEGYTAATRLHRLKVDFPTQLLNKLPCDKRDAAVRVLSLDARPAYIDDPDRIFGLNFAGFNIRFRVRGDLLTVTGADRF